MSGPPVLDLRPVSTQASYEMIGRCDNCGVRRRLVIPMGRERPRIGLIGGAPACCDNCGCRTMQAVGP